MRPVLLASPVLLRSSRFQQSTKNEKVQVIRDMVHLIEEGSRKKNHRKTNRGRNPTPRNTEGNVRIEDDLPKNPKGVQLPAPQNGHHLIMKIWMLGMTHIRVRLLHQQGREECHLAKELDHLMLEKNPCFMAGYPQLDDPNTARVHIYLLG